MSGRVVAVVGASSDRQKFGNKAVRAFQAEGYTVIPVNPNEPEVEGLKTVPSVLDITGDVDMVTVYVPPRVGRTLLPEFEKKGVREIWFNPGSEDDELLADAQRRGLNVIAACSIVGIGRSPYQF